MAIHLVGAPHSGVHELLAALTAELGVHTAQLHPLMQALPDADSALAAPPLASLLPPVPITLLTGLDWPCPPLNRKTASNATPNCAASSRPVARLTGWYMAAPPAA